MALNILGGYDANMICPAWRDEKFVHYFDRKFQREKNCLVKLFVERIPRNLFFSVLAGLTDCYYEYGNGYSGCT
jgi:hypothetical protein